MLTKMDVIRFLRKKGYTVIFTENKDIVMVDGEKSYISLQDKQSSREIYIFNKPQRLSKNQQYTYCFAVFIDKKETPLYRIEITNSTTTRPSVSSSFNSKYPLSFIGYVSKSNRGNRNNHNYVKRDTSGKFVS